MAATITREHQIMIDGANYVVFAEVSNASPVERWRIAVVLGGDWRVASPSYASRKEAVDALYLLGFQVTSAASRHMRR